MPDDVQAVLDDIVAYWRATRITTAVAAGMRAELEAHIAEALAHGRGVADVIGPDVALFAEHWAEVHRPRTPEMPSWEEATAGTEPNRRSLTSAPITWSLMLAGAAIALGLTFGREEVVMEDIENWRWVWTGVALLFAVGEVMTAGFFLLPFAVGAAIAALLAWLSVGVVWQWGAFLVVSIASLVFMRRFTADVEEGPAIGANRYRDAVGTVIEPIDPPTGTGSIRVGTEVWRAKADRHLDAGTRVRIVEVLGTRMRVEAVPEAEQ